MEIKIQLLEPLGHSSSNAKRKVYSYGHLHEGIREISNK
jgi:hypothetical protein